MQSRVQSVEPSSYRINYGSPLANGLVGAWPGGTDVNLVTGRRLTKIGTNPNANLQPFQTNMGKATRFNTEFCAYEDSSIPYYDKNWTVLAIARSNGSSIIPIVSYGGSYIAGNHGWSFQVANGTWFRYMNGPGGSYDVTSTGAGWPIANKTFVVALSCYDNGTSLSGDMFLDGVRRGGLNTSYPLSPATDPFRIGVHSQDNLSGPTYVQGNSTPQAPFIGLVLYWNRTLTKNELQSLTINPWQIFHSGVMWNNILKSQVPSPNPIFLMKAKIGYDNPTYFNNVLPTSGQAVSNRHPGYNFSTTWYNSWSTPSSTVLTVAPNAGDFVFLTIVGSNSNQTTVSDNAGGVWTNIINADSDGSNACSFWYCNNIKAGTTSITATFSGGYPSTVKMVAASYYNMTGATLNNYAPRKTQVNPGTSADAIKSNTSFFNASTYNSSNSSGLVVTTDNALIIGVTNQIASSASYTAGNGYKLRRNYSGVLHQDAEYRGMKDTATIITATDSSGGTNTYTTYGFAFDQPVVSSTWYTAKYGETISRVRFRSTGATNSVVRISLRRVDTNEILYTTAPFTITDNTSHKAWEIPVAWPLTPGVTYALSFYSVDGGANISYNDSSRGESSHGSQYSVGSTWDDSVVYGDYNDSRRYCISGDISKTAFINHRTSGSFQPASSTATSPAFRVEKGDLILISCTFPGTPSSYTVTDNAGNYIGIDRFTGNGSGPNTILMASVQECVTSKSDYQFTITNGSSLTPFTVQYSVYSSSHPWEQVNNYRGVVYSQGTTGTGESYIPKTNKPILTVTIGNSGNTTTTGDTVYSQLTQPVNRLQIPGLAGINPAIVIADTIGRAAANGNGSTYNYGIPNITTSLGASNGVTAAFNGYWTYTSGPHTYRQAVGTTNSGSNVITMMPTRARSLVLVFMSGVGNALSVSDDKGTVYTRALNPAATLAGQQIFYGYPQAGMTKISTVGGNSLTIAIEESEMALIPQISAIDSSVRGSFYYAVSNFTHNNPTLYSDIVYVATTYGYGRRPIRSTDANNIYYPVLTTNPATFPRNGTESGGTDVMTGIQYYEYGDSYQEIHRAEFSVPTSNTAMTAEFTERYVDGAVASGLITRYVCSVALKKPKLMLGPDVTKWSGYNISPGYISNGGTQSGTVTISGYTSRFSGYTTSITMRGTGQLYTNSGIYLAIYDENGAFVAKSQQVGDGTTYYTNAANADVYGDITLPITAYLEKGKAYYIAFFCSNIYYTVAGNPNPNTSINYNRNVGIDNGVWTYSYANPPMQLMQETSSGSGSQNQNGTEYAIWVEGIESYTRQFNNGTFQSPLIESYS